MKSSYFTISSVFVCVCSHLYPDPVRQNIKLFTSKSLQYNLNPPPPPKKPLNKTKTNEPTDKWKPRGQNLRDEMKTGDCLEVVNVGVCRTVPAEKARKAPTGRHR